MPDRELRRVQTLARILDRNFVDPLLGLLLPGAGDLAGSLLGLYAVSLALRRRMSPVVIARMLLNLSADALVGAVPLVGDLFDLGFRAHERNARLLVDPTGLCPAPRAEPAGSPPRDSLTRIERAEEGGRATPRDWILVVGAAAVFVGSLALAIYAVIALFQAIF